jgi:O-antigen/teichoic acid export membrane protein
LATSDLAQADHEQHLSYGRVRSLAAKGILWLGAGRISGRAVDQIFSLVLARLLSPADWGLFALASVFTSLFRIFADLSLGRAIVQRGTSDEEYLSTAFWSSLAAGGILFLGSVAAGEVIGALSGQAIVGPMVAVLATRFVFAAGTTVQLAVLTRRLAFRVVAGRGLAGAALGGVVGVGMALAGAGVWSLVGQAVATELASAVLFWTTIPWRPKRLFSRDKFKDLWDFSGKLMGARLLMYLIRNMDNLLIGKFLGATLLGFYALAYKILMFPLSDVSVIVNNVAFAALSRLNENPGHMREGYRQATSAVALLLMPVMVGLVTVAPWFIEVVFSAKWLPATTVLQILAAAGVFQAITSVGGPVLQAAGRTDLQLRWSVLATLQYLTAFVIGLRWGIEGVAAGFLVVSVLQVPIQITYVRQVAPAGAREFVRALRPAVLGVLVMLAGLLPLGHWLREAPYHAAVDLAVMVVAGAVLYSGTVWFIARQELRSVIGAVMSRREGRRPRAQVIDESGEIAVEPGAK